MTGHFIAGISLLFALLGFIYGSYDSRWVPYPRYNKLSWGFGTGLLSLTLIITSFFVMLVFCLKVHAKTAKAWLVGHENREDADDEVQDDDDRNVEDEIRKLALTSNSRDYSQPGGYLHARAADFVIPTDSEIVEDLGDIDDGDNDLYSYSVLPMVVSLLRRRPRGSRRFKTTRKKQGQSLTFFGCKKVLDPNPTATPAILLHLELSPICEWSQTLNYRNGYRIPDPYPSVGIGGYPLKVNQPTESDLDEIVNYHPLLTNSRNKVVPLPEFIPDYVAFDKKVLRFYGYFKESVTESAEEHYRVRNVIFYYHLEDDSMHIYEPMEFNSGLPQGRIVNRQRIPKNGLGDYYTWKDLNLGMNITIYGRVYRIANCDTFTRNFFESEGIELNESESIPKDPYRENRAMCEKVQSTIAKSTFDTRRQHCELDRQVLRFFAVWDDTKELFGDLRKFSVLYYLSDDTMEVREHHIRNDGRDPCSVLIRRHRFFKNRDNIPATFPIVCLEISSNEIKECYSPKDLRIGESIVIYGRPFLLYDCDSFTKAWYYQNFGLTDFKPISVGQKDPAIREPEQPYCNESEFLGHNLHSISDSHCTRTKFNLGKQADHSTKALRYGAKLASGCPNDSLRKFIISYRLVDDTIHIWEIPVRNSGFPGGTFLKPTRIVKPGSTVEKPDYYGPKDFFIGSIIDAFGTRFLITDADEYVVKFMEAHRDQFPESLIGNLSSKVVSDIIMKSTVESRSCKNGGAANLQRNPGDIDRLVGELALQFRKLALSAETRMDAFFLKYNKDRLCFVDVETLKDICKKLQLPGDEDVLNHFLDKYGTKGRMTIDEFRAFFLDKPKPECSTVTCANSKPCI
ncbi:EF hand domain containing protein 1 [Echinococcus multilocularis]|uniref:EF hand domain containing protein 1 n=2 Tax=Echinococcus multilocularis TaxID=6211 RepID=A0A068YCD5_ECHMU|nr:EF hand domain containing protein 1 [Echinococcus multilocularis]